MDRYHLRSIQPKHEHNNHGTESRDHTSQPKIYWRSIAVEIALGLVKTRNYLLDFFFLDLQLL